LTTEYGTLAQAIEGVLWPALLGIESIAASDEISVFQHHYALSTLRGMIEQASGGFGHRLARGETIMIVSGPDEGNECAGEMLATLLESDGYQVFFTRGIASSDEVVAEMARLSPDSVVVFSASADDLPWIRSLTDRLADWPSTNRPSVIVGGGIFARVPGLAQELGAGMIADDPVAVTKMLGKTHYTAQQVSGVAGRVDPTGTDSTGETKPKAA
jgi:methylmalonyl-CoA mutase cobalamin-binding subunit